ncbi:hypothetical protein [Ferrimonas sp. SCSIO 43195]|uniref:hypothetical protein n=1 Tax=Ferrimonas sp. SCSIO 43195 TaxID=2822844 RepID=UPI002074C31E|nr:hypothetical protein [Ferrimonas sp. SCSIO 43195]USD38749.1 hypothetical protein J8Z22_06510 [Ferrimonas sp. SCSIO 43195]
MNVTQPGPHTPFISATQGDQRVNIGPETDTAVTKSTGSNRDMVTISDEARQKLRNEKSEESDNSGDSPAIMKIKQTIEMLKEKIKAAQEQLEALKQTDMDEEQKQKLLDGKRQEIMMLNSALSEANAALTEAREKEAKQGG